MQSGSSTATFSGPSGAASAVAPRKSMRGGWRRESKIKASTLIRLLYERPIRHRKWI